MNTGILLQIATGLDLETFKFVTTSNPVYNWVFAGIVAVGLVYGVIYAVTRKRRLREQAMAREESRLRLLLTEFNLGEAENELLATLAGSESAMDLIPLITARNAFEQSAANFRDFNPDHPAVKRIPQLRQRLGYGFGNLRNPFTSTRMLPGGIRAQCTIPREKRPVQFVTTLLAVGERAFYMKPPTAKGKPVNLSKIPELIFKVVRDQDAEYEFNARVLGQAQSGLNAVALEHTQSVRKLLFRNAPRVPVSLDVHFFVIKQEVAAERRHRTFKRHESQYSILGRMLDLSLGGLRLQAELPGQRPVEGDLVVFQLPEANIKDDMVAEIIDVAVPKPDWIQLHMQFIGTKEINRLKLSKYLQGQGLAESVPISQDNPAGSVDSPAP